MSVQAILTRLSDAGITVTVKGGLLWLNPRDRVTDAIAAEVREHKPELLTLLSTWDQQHAQRAIAATLRRIESRYPQTAAIGTTWDDDVLGECEERVNTTAQAHDRVAFDEALRAYEAHVLTHYCQSSTQKVAS